MYRRFLSIFFLVLVLLFLPVALVGQLRDGATQLLGPVGGFFIQQSAGVRNFLGSFGQIGDLRTEREDLQRQILELQQQLAEQQNLRQENEALRQELGVTGVTRPVEKVFARIVLQNTDSLDHTFTINVGRDQGVKEGQPAVYQGALVGRVAVVRDRSAVVRSVISSESKIQAKISANQEMGLLEGEGNTVVLSEITQGVAVAPDSIIETSGLGGSLPQGILIGQVEELRSAKSDLSQSFAVKLSRNPKSLSSVFILLTDTP